VTRLHKKIKALRISARSVKILLIAIFTGILFIFLGKDISPPAFSQSSQQPVTQAEIGKDCAKCHKAIVEGFGNNSHGKSAKFIEGAKSAFCETCHTNSEKHVESGKKEDIISPAKMSSKEINTSCLQCHSQDKHTFSWAGGKHDNKDVSCLSCHSQHHSKSEEKMLASFTGGKKCFSCKRAFAKAMHER